jgi:hypothetical protein
MIFVEGCSFWGVISASCARRGSSLCHGGQRRFMRRGRGSVSDAFLTRTSPRHSMSRGPASFRATRVCVAVPFLTFFARRMRVVPAPPRVTGTRLVSCDAGSSVYGDTLLARGVWCRHGALCCGRSVARGGCGCAWCGWRAARGGRRCRRRSRRGRAGRRGHAPRVVEDMYQAAGMCATLLTCARRRHRRRGRTPIGGHRVFFMQIGRPRRASRSEAGWGRGRALQAECGACSARPAP